VLQEDGKLWLLHRKKANDERLRLSRAEMVSLPSISGATFDSYPVPNTYSWGIKGLPNDAFSPVRGQIVPSGKTRR